MLISDFGTFSVAHAHFFFAFNPDSGDVRSCLAFRLRGLLHLLAGHRILRPFVR